MPLAKVYVPQGVLSAGQRNQIIAGISEVINSVEGRPDASHKYTYVIINEIPPSGWGVGGKPYAPGR
ncbi:tautomerase family protein [Aliidongia dinghuensis]|uniref:tautomerase family protein n=1 Tax=Aliidongia dinghuensis TaxID=1867774 RepID=UPI001668AA5E